MEERCSQNDLRRDHGIIAGRRGLSSEDECDPGVCETSGGQASHDKDCVPLFSIRRFDRREYA